MTFYGDHAPHLAASVIVLAVLAYITFALRVYTRLRIGAWGTDDWCMAASIPIFTVLTIACVGCALNGVGVHQARLSSSDEVQGKKFFFLFELFYCAAIVPVKLSISFMLMRIAANTKKYIYSLYVVSAMFTAMNLIALLYIIFNCKPVRFAWDTSIDGKCNPAETLADIYYATTAVNITTDWFCALLPIPLLWNVQLNRNAKLSVGVILSLGILASVSACIRLVYTVNLTNKDEYLFGISNVVLWGYAENAVGIIVACVATLRPLFRDLLKLGGDTGPQDSPLVTAGRRSNVRFGSGKDSEWVSLSDNNKTQSKVHGIMLQDSSGEEHILGNSVRVNSDTLQTNRTV